MKSLLASLMIFLCFASHAGAQEQPDLSERDRIRLAEAFRLGAAVKNHIWPGWDHAPFAVLLITPDYEFLIRHPKPTPDFRRLGHDKRLGSDIYVRKRTFPTNLLATFPAVNGIPTIVIGQAENTEVRSSTPWVLTIMHEHFHQLQMSQPGYSTGTEALGLSGDDKTGMWMLNYAFPYDDPAVQKQSTLLTHQLAEAIAAMDRPDFAEKLAAYRTTREQWQKMLAPRDYRYFSFQLWNEGIARYTELHAAKFAASHYKPDRIFTMLPDYTPFPQVAGEIRKNIERELTTLDIGTARRVLFYPIGAGEGLLLDKVQPEWRQRYLSEMFDIASYFDPIVPHKKTNH